jgi:hypothetical protein
LEQNGSVLAQDEPCGQAAREKDYRLFSWLKLPAFHQDGLFDLDGDNLPLNDLCSDYFKDRRGFFGAILNGICGFHGFFNVAAVISWFCLGLMSGRKIFSDRESQTRSGLFVGRRAGHLDPA